MEAFGQLESYIINLLEQLLCHLWKINQISTPKYSSMDNTGLYHFSNLKLILLKVSQNKSPISSWSCIAFIFNPLKLSRLLILFELDLIHFYLVLMLGQVSEFALVIFFLTPVVLSIGWYDLRYTVKSQRQWWNHKCIFRQTTVI